MSVNTSLAKTRDGVSPHQDWNHRGRHVQELAEQRGIDQNIAIGNLNLHERSWVIGFDPPVARLDGL